MPEAGDEPVQPVAGRARLVAELDPVVLGLEPGHDPAHALLGGIHLAKVADLTAAPALRHGDRVARLGSVDPDESFRILARGSSSCGEDRLGHAERPSRPQRRASHLSLRGGPSVLP
jgi:hypothetical protein